MSSLIDTHVHVHSFGPGELAGVLARAREAGVTLMVAVGCNAEANAAVMDAVARYPETMRAAVGFDRDCAAGTPDLTSLEALIAANAAAVAAVGEIGLDYHYSPESAPAQRALMEAELALARRTRLPVVVHSRDADEDMLALLRAHAAAWPGDPARIGVLHCFTEDEPFAKALLDLGFMISFSGIVTFRNADPLRAVARFVPADRLLIETDTPYLAPVPHRGKPNEPAYLPAVAACLARERQEHPDGIAAVTRENASRLFAWA